MKAGNNKFTPRIGNNRKKPDPAKKKVRQKITLKSQRRNRRS